MNKVCLIMLLLMSLWGCKDDKVRYSLDDLKYTAIEFEKSNSTLHKGESVEIIVKANYALDITLPVSMTADYGSNQGITVTPALEGITNDTLYVTFNNSKETSFSVSVPAGQTDSVALLFSARYDTNRIYTPGTVIEHQVFISPSDKSTD